MEAAGAIDMFIRFIDKNNLIHEYLEDDTSFKVGQANPFEKYIIPSKLECIGHVQKCLATKLCNCVRSHKGTNKPISGKGMLFKKLSIQCIIIMGWSLETI